ncbi:hypothetical protein VIGAN_06061000 [Vigna angularis var. angularis]|uniref:Fructose-1-6-bisphosphatase class I N-terminal domain-containing protein n=1 Tax=Vigna angularis var. angularis TaxID=157739 RepID=A0A0S3S9Z6_PHAAN|nr:hypothetical protein VIGAN_06061000 [Vigna angularis var. angularis]
MPSIFRPPISGDAALSSPRQISPSVSCRHDEPTTTYIFFIATNRKTYSRRHHHEPPLRFVPPKSQPFTVAPRFATTISTKPSHCETCRKLQQDHLATTESRVIHRLSRTTSKPTSLIIFGIYMVKNEAKVSLEDAMQPGNQMLAAGYCVYGSSCTFAATRAFPDHSLRPKVIGSLEGCVRLLKGRVGLLWNRRWQWYKNWFARCAVVTPGNADGSALLEEALEEEVLEDANLVDVEVKAEQ